MHRGRPYSRLAESRIAYEKEFVMRTAIRFFFPVAASTLALGWTASSDGQADAASTAASIEGDVRVERLATLEYPWGMELLPDGRVLITEKPGRLRIFDGRELSQPVDGVPA